MSSRRSLSFGLLLAALTSGAALFGQTAPTATSGSEGTPSSVQPSTVNPTFNYTQDNLVADLAQQLSERYRVTGELQVDLLRSWSPPRSTEPLSLVVLDAPSVLASTLLVHFRLQAGTQSVAETSILVRVQLMREVWCARNPAEHGSTFDPSQCDTRRVDTLRERDTVATTETTSEMSLARTVPAGRVLTWHDLARRPLVRKGQVIEVNAVAGALTVSMKGLAMENGTAGETVRVRNMESKKEFSALVVADSRAEVRL